MRFEWDEAKAEANLRKHGVPFTMAARALADEDRLEDLDDRLPYGEDRVNALCRIQQSILMVSYTDRGTVIRIISARKATRHEQHRYFDR